MTHKWRTLVELVDENHKARLKQIGDELNVPPSKIVGKLIHNWIEKYDRETEGG